MTSDERNLLMLLARIVASGLRKPSPTDQELNEAIRRIEDAESRKRDQFVDQIMHPETDAKYRQRLYERSPNLRSEGEIFEATGSELDAIGNQYNIERIKNV